MNIAVIGAGVSGLVATYLLSRRHRVELFEREARAGGHANTVLVEGSDGGVVPLDVGFIVYNERTYPAFTRLLRELGVATQRSEMSFSVRCDAHDLEYSSRGLGGYLAQPRNLLSGSHSRMLFDLTRFHRDARRAVADDTLHHVSFADYLERHRFSSAFQRHLIVPLTAATWSNAPSDVLRFPANYLFRFLNQHGVLAPNQIPEWRWLQGGARTYVQRILGGLPEGAFHPAEAPVTIRRDDQGTLLTFDGGYQRRFDAVVLACHPDQALSMLGDPTIGEHEALSGFRYAANRVVLHTDEGVLPKRAKARASWNYYSAACSEQPETLTMTYDLNRLQGLRSELQYCVSVNPGDRIEPTRVLAEFDYAHPVYSMGTLRSQRLIEGLNGARSTFYAGAYLGYGFHEDGVQSAVRVARLLGVEW